MNYLGYLLFVTAVPALIGRFFVSEEDGAPYTLPARWCAGFVCLLGLMYLPAVAGIYFKWTLTQLTFLYMGLVAALCAAAAFRLAVSGERPVRRVISAIKGGNLFELIAFALPAAHAVCTFLMMHVDDDDVAYIGAVTTSVDTNSLMKFDAVTGNLITSYATNEMNRLVASPQFAFYAVISKAFKIRPAVLCHTFFPPVLTMLFYTAFLLAGRELFQRDRKKTAIFTILVFLINMSSYFSVYTAGTFLMIRSWQGKAQIVGLILPLLFALSFRILGRGTINGADLRYLAALLAAGCLLTSMGGVLAAGAAGLLLLLIAVLKRKGRILLYAIPAYFVPAVMLGIYFTLK